MTVHWRSLGKSGRVDAIRSVYQPGMSTRAIGQALGIKKAAICGMYYRYRDDLADCPLLQAKGDLKKRTGSKPRDPYLVWTREQRATIADMLRNKCSAGTIAGYFGKSRNAIIGLVTRDPVLAEIGFNCGRGKGSRGGKSIPASQPTTYGLPVNTVGRPLMAMGHSQCRWPVNDAEPGELHLFCGQASDGSYCPQHMALAYRPRVPLPLVGR